MAREPGVHLSLVRSARDLFEAAAAHVRDETAAVLGEEHVPPESGDLFFERLCVEIRGRLGTPSPGPAPAALTSDPLFLPLVALLKAEMLRPDLGRESASAALEVLATLEGLTRAGGDAHGSAVHDLRARLRAPDAFELLLEAAHDFRSPLTSILFLSETLRDGNSGPVGDLQRSQLGLIYSAAFGLAAVASDIIDLARREQDLIQDETQPYRVAEVFDTVRRLVNPIVEEKGLELRVELPEGLYAHGHPQAVSRVLLNLTTNALKFTDEGFVTIGVQPRPRARLEFFVQDTGRGIPEARRPELFHPFKRRLGEGQEGYFFSGSGVGLSIAHRLVCAMGSELVLESSNESGTRFSFEVHAGPARRASL